MLLSVPPKTIQTGWQQWVFFNNSELPEPRDKKALAFFQRFTGSECSQCCISLHFTPKTSGRTSFCRYESAEDSQNVGCLQTSLFQLVICLRKRLPLASFIENHSNRLTAVELLGTIESYMNHVITCRRDHSVSQLSFSMALGRLKTRRAAAFWIIWSGRVAHAGSPASSELQ